MKHIVKKSKKEKFSEELKNICFHCNMISLYSEAAWNSKVMIMKKNYAVRPVYICVWFAVLHKMYPTFCVIAKCDGNVHV